MVRECVCVIYGYESSNFKKAMLIYPEIKNENFNCLSIVTKKRTLDLEISKPKNLFSTLVALNSLISISHEQVISRMPFTKSNLLYLGFFVFKRLRMLIKYECTQQDMTINELWIVAMIKITQLKITQELNGEKIAMLEEDKFKLYGMLMLRFDLGGKIIKCIRKINQLTPYEAQIVKNQAFNKQNYLTAEKLTSHTLNTKREQFRIEGLQYKKNLKLLQRVIEIKYKQDKKVTKQEKSMKQTAKFLEKQLSKQFKEMKNMNNHQSLNYEISRFNILSKAIKLENPILNIKYKSSTLKDFISSVVPKFVIKKQQNSSDNMSQQVQESKSCGKSILTKIQLQRQKSIPLQNVRSIQNEPQHLDKV